MSLINDALKRTQQSTQANEPSRPEELELRPIEPAQPPSTTGGGAARQIIWILVLAVVAGNIVLWIVFKDRGNETEVAARSGDAAAVAVMAPQPEPEPEPVVAEPELVPGVPAETADPEPAEVPVLPPVEVEAAALPAVERPELKLRTIVTHPTRPSAMINNRVVFVGDTFEGYTVTAIGTDQVTLLLNGQEVVVSLP